MDGRILRAMLVCFALYIGYEMLSARFGSKPAPATPPPAGSAPAPSGAQVPAAKPASSPDDAAEWVAVPEENARLTGTADLVGTGSGEHPPRWKARLTARGGAVLSWTILADGNPEMRRDGQTAGAGGTGAAIGNLAMVLGENGEKTVSLADLAWAAAPQADGGTVFSARLANGLVVRKAYVPGPTPDGFTLSVSFRNDGKALRTFTPMLLAGCGLPRVEDRQDTPYALEGVILTRREDGSIRRVGTGLGGTGEGMQVFTEGLPVWAGIANKYFFLAARPARGEPVQAAWETLGKDEKADLALWFRGPRMDLAPGAEQSVSCEILAFPKKPARAAAHPDLEPAVDLGITRWIQAPLLAVLTFLDRLVGNWGVAILLLTLLVKVVLHPLSVSQQGSMLKMSEKMKKLQPKLEEINAKYKSNMRKRTEETMKLYKEHGNPQMAGLKGCLPMLLQMPVMIAMYWVIAEAVELRGAPFAGWIRDLSVPDRLAHLPSWAQIHLLFITIEDVNLLPILMTVASFVQMWMTPQPPAADPDQAKQQKLTQYIMFGMMGFMFYNMSSGLVLYWLLSTVLGIVESKYIKKKLVAAGVIPATPVVS